MNCNKVSLMGNIEERGACSWYCVIHIIIIYYSYILWLTCVV